MTEFKKSLVKACQDELSLFGNGRVRETDPEASGRIGEYWQAVGVSGRNGMDTNYPWSAAFVSYCIQQAGAEDAFKYHPAHCYYVNASMNASDRNDRSHGYIAHTTQSYRPEIGDIIVGGRGCAAYFDYSTAQAYFSANKFYASHGDIIIDVKDRHIVVVGGNLSQSVTAREIQLDDDGLIAPRQSASVFNSFARDPFTASFHNRTKPWITILECKL